MHIEKLSLRFKTLNIHLMEIFFWSNIPLTMDKYLQQHYKSPQYRLGVNQNIYVNEPGRMGFTHCSVMRCLSLRFVIHYSWLQFYLTPSQCQSIKIWQEEQLHFTIFFRFLFRTSFTFLLSLWHLPRWLGTLKLLDLLLFEEDFTKCTRLAGRFT